MLVKFEVKDLISRIFFFFAVWIFLDEDEKLDIDDSKASEND